MRVAFVANKPVSDFQPDLSSAIDSYDIVARVSKMEYMKSGKIGSKTDILFLEPKCHRPNPHRGRKSSFLR